MSYQAIETKVLSPTNTKPRRYKATCGRGSLIVSSNHDRLSRVGRDEPTHACVAKLLCEKFEAEDTKKGYGSGVWTLPFVSGCLANGNWVHVFPPAPSR